MPRLPLPIGCVVALLAPVVVHATTATGSALASVQVRIDVVIAPLVQVLANSHTHLPGSAAPLPHRASQQLVVTSNLRQGFCLHLHADGHSVGGWRVRSVGDGPVQVDAVGNGWRVCGHRQGLHTLRLVHEFDTSVESAWPVRTELTLL